MDKAGHYPFLEHSRHIQPDRLEFEIETMSGEAATWLMRVESYAASADP